MVKTKSIRRNFIYNLLYKLLAVAVPLISTPYLSHIFLSEGVGVYNYAVSYVAYFAIAAYLGFSYYGERAIAKSRDDAQEKSRVFWEILFAKGISTALCLAAYVIFASFQNLGPRYETILWIETVNIFAIAIDASFFLQGEEEFGIITLRDCVVKMATLAAIFLFVKKSTDLWVYTTIVVSGVLLTNVTVWPPILKRLTKVDMKRINPLKHLLPSLILFLPTAAAKIYPMVDKTLLGLLTGSDEAVGNYAKASQIIDFLVSFVMALGVVIVPRNAYLFQNGKRKEAISNIKKAFHFIWLMGIPLSFGSMAIASSIVPWYLGTSFDPAIGLLQILGFTVLISGIRNILGVQYLMASGKDKTFAFTLLGGTIFNIGISVLLVFWMGAAGAAVGSLLSEAAMCAVMFVFARKDFSFWSVFKLSWRAWTSGGIMFVFVYFLGSIFPATPLYSIAIVAAGALLYFAILFVLRDPMLISLLKQLEPRIVHLFAFAKKAWYPKFVSFFLVLIVFVSTLSYSPILLKYSVNSYIPVIWGVYFLLLLPISWEKIGRIIPIALICWMPFFSYVVSLSFFTGNNLILTDYTRLVLLSAFVFISGSLSSVFFNKRNVEIMCGAYFIAAVLVAMNIYFQYFLSFSFDTVSYAYAGKNGVSPVLLTAIIAGYVWTRKHKWSWLKWPIYIIDLLLFVFLAMLKCRAVLVCIPILFVFELFNQEFKKSSRLIAAFMVIAAAVFVLVVPPLRELVIDKILFANRAETSWNGVSSGRLDLISEAFQIYVLSPLLGVGSYYIDFGPLQILMNYGVCGMLLLIPALVMPFYVAIKNQYRIPYHLLRFTFCVLIIIYTTMLFEAFSPFGPGVRNYLAWLLAGVCYGITGSTQTIKSPTDNIDHYRRGVPFTIIKT